MEKDKKYKKRDDLNLDLRVITIWTILTFVLSYIKIEGSEIIVTILAIPVILFIPGYLLMSLLFPKRNVKTVEMMILSFGLSIVIIPFLGMILNISLGIKEDTVLTILGIYLIICVIATLHKRKSIPIDRRIDRGVGFDENIKNIMGNGIYSMVFIIILVLTIFVTYYTITMPKLGERFTEFYILNASKETDNYGDSIYINVANHEYSPINYTVTIVANGNTLSSEDLSLNHNEKWEKDILLDKEQLGKIEFLLFKENNFTEPYRSLQIWI